MSWKDWPYWLKGGAIGSIFFTIFFLTVYVVGFIFITHGILLDLFDILFLVFSTVISLTTGDFLFSSADCRIAEFLCLPNTLGVIKATIFYSIISFLISALIGWIYGKIKNRNNN